jgi:DNA-directed RNA polymerase specialized sigma subunit
MKRNPNNDTATFYVDKVELKNEIIRSQKIGATDDLAEMFIKMVNGVALRFNNLSYYGILDDTKQDCLLLLLQKFRNFDTSRDTSCFAYFTTVIYNHIRYKLSKAKKDRDKLDEMTHIVREYIEKIEGQVGDDE